MARWAPAKRAVENSSRRFTISTNSTPLWGNVRRPLHLGPHWKRFRVMMCKPHTVRTATRWVHRSLLLSSPPTFLSTCHEAPGWQRTPNRSRWAVAPAGETYGIRYKERRLSMKPGLDLDALMSANKYGGTVSKVEQKNEDSNPLDALMSKNR